MDIKNKNLTWILLFQKKKVTTRDTITCLIYNGDFGDCYGT